MSGFSATYETRMIRNTTDCNPNTEYITVIKTTDYVIAEMIKKNLNRLINADEYKDYR